MTHRERLEAVVAAEHVYPEGKFSGRGIVIGAGGAKFFACAWSCAHSLRGLGCTLPIEFWYLDAHEMDPAMLAAAAAVGIRCVNARAIGRTLPCPPRILNGWELKPFSVIHSAFQEVLYLDADQLPVEDPTFLFHTPEYLATRAIFWPDLPPHDRNEWLPATVWQAIGLPYSPSIDFESGQFLVDKRVCWRELQVTMHLNEWSDYWYQLVYGDKSTYHLAWRKCGREYSMPAWSAGWKWPAILQHDFSGRLIFQHCCRGKEDLVVGNALKHLKSWHLNHQAARTLREHWRGEIWSWLDQSPGETELARGRIGAYQYDRVGLGARRLELLDGGHIGRGQAACEKRWTLRVLDGVPTLVIVGEAHKSSEIGMMFLVESPDGVWRGAWAEFERCLVELTPQ